MKSKYQYTGYFDTDGDDDDRCIAVAQFNDWLTENTLRRITSGDFAYIVNFRVEKQVYQHHFCERTSPTPEEIAKRLSHIIEESTIKDAAIIGKIYLKLKPKGIDFAGTWNAKLIIAGVEENVVEEFAGRMHGTALSIMPSIMRKDEKQVAAVFDTPSIEYTYDYTYDDVKPALDALDEWVWRCDEKDFYFLHNIQQKGNLLKIIE